MFADELDRIDRALHSKQILSRERMRAYYEFRDPSEPVERLHPVAPRQAWPRVEWPTVSEECSVCGERFWSKKEYYRHMRAHRIPRVQAPHVAPAAPVSKVPARIAPGDISVWTCVVCGLLRYQFSDSVPPENCKHCGCGQFERSAYTGRAAA